ncbi:hypothetical protein [Streptomyces chryseus]|uniref:Uncharacterized protein n=1 Tax=Streptomyces chryseus TaxID=68186 RepID=A0ABQ3EB61_9ACTN|nr:hypothetical protein [Streptomyces chryseus]GHB32203.1 hypothetical protein GCM10010346_64410 [Streptomyces chryseus]
MQTAARLGRLWFLAAEAVLTLLVARTLWTWRDDPYVLLADVPYLLWSSVGLTLSLAVSLALLSREPAWARRVGWSLTVVRLCLLPLLGMAWYPAMSPHISLW